MSIITRNSSSNTGSNSSMSISELTALSFMSTLPMKVVAKQTFAPLLPIHYQDGDGIELVGKPDSLCTQPRSYSFIENKNGVLNEHP